MELPSQYNAKEVEDKIYQLWEKSGFFNPDNLPTRHKKPFCIIMPPPNSNGSLHIGHALFVTLEDVMTRYQRMQGKKALWLPGADHAGFETQVVYDKKLEKEGRNRFQIPKDQLYQEILEFTLANKKVMERQLKKLGASCDWSREKFTLDENIIKVVYETFEKLKKDELVYKGKRIVNWCVKHQTSLSELELKYEDRTSPLYYIKYPFSDKNGFLIVATTRPETMLGDTAVAVNPKDEKYKGLIGRKIILPLTGREIEIISDDAIDKEFGTGAVKVTPAHDMVDFEIGQKHKLETIQIISNRGKIINSPEKYNGLNVEEARKKIVEDLQAEGLLEKVDSDYKNRVSLCYKCARVIEPMPLDNQWFVRMTAKPKSGKLSLRDSAVKAVKDKKIVFVPKRMEKIFLHWMKNLRDWNISRQITWGIPIPGDENGQVFDTWFSSGQWPFATLKSTKKGDFEKFYPTDVMETGWDILFFWVARMTMLGIYATGEVPFKNVYLHGLVRDKDKQKMSKSKGNVIDPLGVMDIYGTDALRMALVVGNTPGNDLAISEEKIKGYRNFATKIWNASRFVMMQTGNSKFEIRNPKQTLNSKDKKLIKDFKKIAKEVTKEMDEFKFYVASEKIYHYFWHTFCDKIIEDYKEKRVSQYVLLTLLSESLKLLHPFMPFVTEEIYQQLPIKKKQKCLMVESWPK
ncbi:MAG: class I tRNA ligase family protein [Candidatus Staskawiczbacteria bacterium]|nr:class I tRNA ligase family protein [Candidatus Staskawiczbacteria bacterium]